MEKQKKKTTVAKKKTAVVKEKTTVAKKKTTVTKKKTIVTKKKTTVTKKKTTVTKKKTTVAKYVVTAVDKNKGGNRMTITTPQSKAKAQEAATCLEKVMKNSVPVYNTLCNIKVEKA